MAIGITLFELFQSGAVLVVAAEGCPNFGEGCEIEGCACRTAWTEALEAAADKAAAPTCEVCGVAS